MKIIRTKAVPSILSEVTNGDVFYIIGEGGELFIAGEWGIGIDSEKRQATSLEDGSVRVLVKEVQVVPVKGAFVLEE